MGENLMAKAIPTTDIDMFNAHSVRNARAVDDGLREMAPVVWLEREAIAMVGRYESVSKGLVDWKAFSNTSRPWHDPKSVRPEILLTDDPPRHTQVRAVIGRALSPKAMKQMEEAFRREAEVLVDVLLDRAGKEIDAVAGITARYVHKVLPDLMGLQEHGREKMTPFGNAVWATMGPMNELFHAAMAEAGDSFEWVDQACSRENIRPDSLGGEMYAAADRGEISEADAKLLTLTILSAGSDTTVITMGNALNAFARFPDEYAILRAEPALLRNAFDEALRWDSPSRMAGRIAKQDVAIEDYVIPAGTRCGLMFAAANRDPRKWDEPERFSVRRDVRGHLGWGQGIHMCVGKALAQMEADALLGEIVRRVVRIEPAGEPEPWMTTIGHGPIHVPVRLHAA
jgi:4-methoxybenzoate monooxygenase (O-demethylating)